MGSGQWATSWTDHVRAQKVDHGTQLGAISQVSIIEGECVIYPHTYEVRQVWTKQLLELEPKCLSCMIDTLAVIIHCCIVPQLTAEHSNVHAETGGVPFVPLL